MKIYLFNVRALGAQLKRIKSYPFIVIQETKLEQIHSDLCF